MAKWKQHPMKHELTRVGLLVEFAPEAPNVCMDASVMVALHLSLSLSIYIYIYVCLYIYIYIYIYIHVYVWVRMYKGSTSTIYICIYAYMQSVYSTASADSRHPYVEYYLLLVYLLFDDDKKSWVNMPYFLPGFVIKAIRKNIGNLSRYEYKSSWFRNFVSGSCFM